jgi:hypothetical protein
MIDKKREIDRVVDHAAKAVRNMPPWMRKVEQKSAELYQMEKRSSDTEANKQSKTR